MSTDIRPELSKENPYWISRHRFYELKHFCLQYHEWRDELNAYSYGKNPLGGERIGKGSGISDPVITSVIQREILTDHIDMINKAAKGCSDDLGKYIFKGVTEGLSFEYLFTQNGIPCCKETYYASFRKFFWILSKLRK